MRWAGRLLAVGLILVGLSACVAPDLPYAELEERYASPASRYLETDEGLRIHYRDEGPRDAPTTIVLVHGFAASLHAWEPWVARLSPDYRMVSLDLPGHGLTRAPEDYEITPASQVAVVDAVAGHLELEPFVIAGNSMGGAVAWRYTLAHPDIERAGKDVVRRCLFSRLGVHGDWGRRQEQQRHEHRRHARPQTTHRHSALQGFRNLPRAGRGRSLSPPAS